MVRPASVAGLFPSGLPIHVQCEMVIKKSAGATVLVAGAVQTSDPRRPALEALIPNLSLNVSDTLRATRAKR